MKFFKYILIFLFVTLTLHANLKEEYTFGITIYKFDKVYQNKAKRLILKTLDKMAEKLDSKISVIFIDSEDKLLEDFKKFEKMNTMIVYSSFYLKNKEEIKKISKNPFLFNNSKKMTQYYLIANKKSNIKSSKDLKNKSFASLTIDDNYSTWIDFLVRKNLNTSFRNIIKNEKRVNKNEKLLLNVYFNKVDFTAVSKIFYDDMVLLNPSITKNLVIIEKSEPIFFFSLGLFHKNTPSKLTEAFHRLIDDGSFNKEFRNLYKVLNLYGIQKTSFESLKSLDDFYNNYLKLKEDNKNVF